MEDEQNVREWPVLVTYEAESLDKATVPYNRPGTTLTIKKVALVETKYKDADGNPRKRILVETDKGTIWPSWSEVNKKLKVWFGDNTKDWAGKQVEIVKADIIVGGETKQTLRFHKV